MKYVQINSVPFGSTGRVMKQIHEERLSLGDDSYMLWGRGRAGEGDHEYNYGTPGNFYFDVAETFLDGRSGFHSKAPTTKLLKKLDEIDPDVVHLHNIHGYHVNIAMLFDWLARHECKLRWTLHDCWAFTSNCAYFTYVGCDQWKKGCEDCPQLMAYPPTFSKSSCLLNYEEKKRLFTSIDESRVTLFTPSQWLADLVKESYLSRYDTVVHHNIINEATFHPTTSNFRDKHGIGDRYLILGVAMPWDKRKGLQDFVRLSGMVDDRFVIVLVGLSKKQIKQLPNGVIGLERTSSPYELACIYSAADVFFNPTWEDNYPTVNLESEACGTPVISYDTGGCRETLRLSESTLVNPGDLDETLVLLNQRCKAKADFRHEDSSSNQ